MKVGFITPVNEKILMNYDEVEEFCKGLCFLDENIESFKEFSKDYSYFHPYFDFVMIKMNYIFINPLLVENTYLKSIGKNMYVVETKLGDYEYINELAIQKKFSDYYEDITAANDKNLGVSYVVDKDNIETWLVDPNGYAMIAITHEGNTNHEITANTVINQILISSPDLYLSFPIDSYSLTYLIENFGFLQTISYYDADFGIIIGFGRLLSQTLIDYENRILKNENIIYQELETEYNNLNDTNKVERLKTKKKSLSYNFSKVN